MNFTLRQLEYAVAAAHHLNFGKAAKVCHVSQPSLSAQLSQLEKALQQSIFERKPNGVVLTPFGESFIPEAKLVLSHACHIEDLAKAAREPMSGRIRLGVIPTVAPFVLPNAIPLIHDQHPQASLYLVEASTRELLQRLADRQLDVLLLALEADLGNVETIPIFKDPFFAVLPPNHPKVADSQIDLSSIDRDELLLLEEEHCLSQQVEHFCSIRPGERIDDFRASSLTTLVQMVAMGMGITLLPSAAQKMDLVRGSGVHVRPLSEEAFRTIGLAWRPNCPRRHEFELLAQLIEKSVADQVQQ